MKLFVFTAGFYDRDYDEKLNRLITSCDKYDITLHVYGHQEFFSFYESKINQMAVQLSNVKDTFTHALYTDASDSFFLTGLDEIIQKYEKLGSPKLVVSGEKGCHPFGNLADLFPTSPTPYRFMNPGNFIAEIPYLLEVLGHCKEFPHLQTDDQGHWNEAWLKHKFEIKIDQYCDLFQPMSDADFEEEFTIKDGRLLNLVTEASPCIVHFNGPKDDHSVPLATRVFDETVGVKGDL